jgi:hypothetical protein
MRLHLLSYVVYIIFMIKLWWKWISCVRRCLQRNTNLNTSVFLMKWQKLHIYAKQRNTPSPFSTILYCETLFVLNIITVSVTLYKMNWRANERPSCIYIQLSLPMLPETCCKWHIFITCVERRRVILKTECWCRSRDLLHYLFVSYFKFI